jgi:LPS-assembly lipoprotein
VNPSLGARTRHPWLVTVFRSALEEAVPAACVLALLALVALGGCGFHLQGSGQLPEDTRRVFIATADELTPFAVELRRAIERAGGTIARGSGAADLVVRIQRDRSGRRVLSVSARNTPQEYEVFYNVEYTVDRGGQEVVERQPLELIRNLSFEESQLLAKDREEAILRDAMARDLAMLVVRRLESIPETATTAAGESQGSAP